MKKTYPNTRLRRLRATKSIRKLVKETTLSSHDLIQPIFLVEGKSKKEKIKAYGEKINQETRDKNKWQVIIMN